MTAIELDIDWPESNDDFWKDGEEGAYAMGYEDGRDKTVWDSNEPCDNWRSGKLRTSYSRL
ncbi:hypothetical protein ACSSL9_23025 [Escherichia coli]|uniref:hypothetical protein n=1 Tax=Escherichia coli TaxID=562 RepID=UPI003FD44207